MLVILNDPTGVTGIKRYPFDLSISLQENIERHLSGGADADLRINGQKVDPLTDHRLDMPPFPNDVVIVALRPRGVEAAIIFDFIAANWVTIAAATLSLYSLTVRPPGFSGDVSGAGNDSPNNRLTGQTNIARTYQAIPDVYGLRRVWPDLIQPSVIEYIDHVKYITETMVVSRGTGDINDVKFGDTPLSDIEGASFTRFDPSAIGSNPPYFSNYVEHGLTTVNDGYEAFQSNDVNGQELPYVLSTGSPFSVATNTFVATSGSPVFTITSPYSSSMVVLRNIAGTSTPVTVYFDYSGGTFNASCTVLSFSAPNNTATITFQAPSNFVSSYSESLLSGVQYTPSASTTYAVVGPFTLPKESDRIWWNLTFPRGLQGSVDIRAEFWQIDALGAEISGTRQVVNRTYTDYTYDQRFYTEKITPTAGEGRYRIQFERRSAQVDANGADVCKLEEVFAVRYYASKNFPGCTIIRVTTKATTAATGVTERKVNLMWQRRVRTFASESISGSRNFGRALAHVWCLAGNDISGLDTTALAAINAELGETSELLRFDGSLDDANMSLGERMQLIADHARCIIWRDGAKWTVRRNQAQQYPVMQLDYRNLASNGESSITYAGHLPASFDGVEVEYVDEATQSKKAYVRLNISSGTPTPGIGANMKKVQMLGCTTELQAENRAYFEANRLIYQRTTVNDTALSDVWAHGPGALVRWVDPNDFGGDLQAGEVMSLSGSNITTSEPLDFAGYSSGRIVFTGEYGQRLGAPVVCTPNPDGSIALASVPSGLYTADDDRQCGSRYAFATGLTSDELDSAGLYLIADVKPGADGTASVSLVNYDSRIFESDSPPTTILLDTFTASDGTDPASRDMDVYPSGAPRWITDIQGTIEANQLTRRTASASMNLYLTNPGYASFFDTTTYAAIVDITATDSISLVGIALYSGNFDSASPEISINRIPGTLQVRVSNNRTTGGPVLDLSVSASAYVGQEMRCAVYANGNSYSLIVNGAVVASGTQAFSSMAVDEIGASIYVPSAGLTPKPSINRIGLYKSLSLNQAIALTVL